MVDLYVASAANGGSNANDGLSSSTPKTNYSNTDGVQSIATEGDIVHHDNTLWTTDWLRDFPAPSAGPAVSIVAVDWATQLYSIGGGFQPNGFASRNSFNIYGLTIRANSGWYFELGANGFDARINLYDCTLEPRLANLKVIADVNYKSTVLMRGCTLLLNNGRPVSVLGAGLQIIGGTLGQAIATDGLIDALAGSVRVTGLDVSLMTGGALINPGSAFVEVAGVELPAGVSKYASSIDYNANGTVALDHVGTGVGSTYSGVSGAGRHELTSSVARSGGGSVDGIDTSLIVTPDVQAVAQVYEHAIPLMVPVIDLGTVPATVRVYLSQPNGATPLTDADVTLDIDYLSAATSQRVTGTTRLPSPLSASAALATDAGSTWAGLASPVAQYVDVAVTSSGRANGYVRCTLHVGAPTATAIYVDPLPALI